METLTYVISAGLAGVAGICYASYIGEMSQQVGNAYELYAITAAVLGKTRIVAANSSPTPEPITATNGPRRSRSAATATESTAAARSFRVVTCPW